jgi:hypothetical protein
LQENIWLIKCKDLCWLSFHFFFPRRSTCVCL